MSERNIDWKEVHRRIEAIGTTIKGGFTPSPEETGKVLKARAKILARERKEAEDAEVMELLEFVLANERYGIEAEYVSEVYPLKDYTPLPCTPAFVVGLLNVRGRIVSMVDIKKFFEMPEKGISDLNKVIVIRNDNLEFGILADSIIGVRRIAVSEIQPSLPTLVGIRERFLRGVTAERMVVLDAKKLLEDKNIIVHEEA